MFRLWERLNSLTVARTYFFSGRFRQFCSLPSAEYRPVPTVKKQHIFPPAKNIVR